MLFASALLATLASYALAQVSINPGYCPGGSVSYPPPSPPITVPLPLVAPSPTEQKQSLLQAAKSHSVLGLTSSIPVDPNRPTAVLTTPNLPAQPTVASTASGPAQASFDANKRPAFPSPQCNYSCYGDSSCSASEKCCADGCVNICRTAVQLTSPPVTCAQVKCAAGSQCLNLESGAICDTGPLHAGTCPDASTFYGGSFSGCTSDSGCNTNEKCCQTQSTGFVCTPITRPLPITCDDVYCAGNKVCTNRTANGQPKCVPNKRGQCPYYEVLYGPLRSFGGRCLKQCSIDVDCKGNLKCCQIGCDMICIPPDLSYTCECKQCVGPFVCTEDEYGYGTCTSVTKKPGMCPRSPIIFDILPCIGNNKPGRCGVDGDCKGNQKCCRSDYCQPSMCQAPETSCEDIYCNYDERCDNSTGIALCVKGLCPPLPDVKPFCPVSGLTSNTCSSDANCGANGFCSSRICCPGVCGKKTCRKSGIYCGYQASGGVLVCPANDLCLNPLYPAVPNYTCYNPNKNQQQIEGCF